MKEVRYRVRKLLFVAHVRAKNSDEARNKARRLYFDESVKTIGGMFVTEVYPQEGNAGLFVCNVFNLYFPEQLGFLDSVHHILSMLNAATFNIGVAPQIIKIE